MFLLIAINFSQKSPHFSLLSPTSPCELSEREVTSPSNLKVVGVLDNYSLVFVIFIVLTAGSLRVHTQGSFKYTCMIFILRETRTAVREWACCYMRFQFTWTKGPCELLPSLGVRRLSSVNFSHFKLLLRKKLADWIRTQQECSLDGPLQSYCFSFQSDIQYGCQGQ